MQQAITWASVNLDLCRHMASLSPKELTTINQITPNKATILVSGLGNIKFDPVVSTSGWYLCTSIL